MRLHIGNFDAQRSPEGEGIVKDGKEHTGRAGSAPIQKRLPAPGDRAFRTGARSRVSSVRDGPDAALFGRPADKACEIDRKARLVTGTRCRLDRWLRRADRRRPGDHGIMDRGAQAAGVVPLRVSAGTERKHAYLVRPISGLLGFVAAKESITGEMPARGARPAKMATSASTARCPPPGGGEGGRGARVAHAAARFWRRRSAARREKGGATG